MKSPFSACRHCFAVLLAALCLLSACTRNIARVEEKEENHPRYREGKAKMQQLDFDGAIKVFESLLREQPGMVRPHLELGVLYDERKKDYVRAIYHYQTYLELRPDTDKRKWLEQAVNHAKMSFVATFPMSPPAARQMEANLSELEALRVQNGRLLDTIRHYQGLAGATPPAPGPAPVRTPDNARSSSAPVQLPSAAPGPAIPPAPPGSYVVQSGDTLGKIAIKVYGDSSKWNLIYEANKATIPNKTRLQIGQPLIIPN